jgi:hypothetical protein
MTTDNLTLFCRECLTTWHNIDPDTGVCTVCETPNILQRFKFLIECSLTGYDHSDLANELQIFIDHAIERGLLPQDTVVI